MTFLVYKIANGIRPVYIGVTTGSLAKRWREHRCAAKSGNENVLYRAIRKYGEDAFSITLVYEATSKRTTGARYLSRPAPEQGY